MLKHKEKLSLFFMVLTICAFINQISIISILFFAIGYAMVISVLEITINEGNIKMKKVTRKTLLTIGITITTISLIDEISTISLIMFFLGFLGIILIFEKQINKQKDNKN